MRSREAAEERAALRAEPLGLCGAALEADPSGALLWPDEGLLVVADLHLEKGSSLAARRSLLLPPYDTAATLALLAGLIARVAPRRVVALGDSFHDPQGPARLTAEARACLSGLMRGREWVWVTGNHDPRPLGLGGDAAAELAVGPLVFRHLPQPDAAPGEVAGHLHPAARLLWAGRSLRRRCFAHDARRLVLPAFGAYAGGLNVLDAAFGELFGGRPRAMLLGRARVYPVPSAHLVPDRA